MKKLLVVVGPTGTGKTDLALEFAKKLDGEIISADSRQIYKGMDIGTGKITVDQKITKHEGYWLVDGIPVYLYDVANPDSPFSVAQFQQLAYEKIHEIQSKNKLPILVGGTGLYVRAVVQGLKVPQVEPDKKLRSKLEKKPLPMLLTELEKVDPKAYLKVDKSNLRRVIRALEVFYKTGQPISSLAQKYKPHFDTLQIGLTAPREILYEKTDERVDKWFDQWFINEVRGLSKKYDSNLPSMSSLGYRQIISYLNRKIPLERAVQRIKFDHHGYIRRQFTWFKKEVGITWFDISQPSFKEKAYLFVLEWINAQD